MLRLSIPAFVFQVNVGAIVQIIQELAILNATLENIALQVQSRVQNVLQELTVQSLVHAHAQPVLQVHIVLSLAQ